ncbi:hypothetical protein, partial [uncultured Methanobrevibacter sp.]|uniref:hypothetical protein n=1 Tax=uncultured Methanobrevibacter sp. TaxID=253161 RepID=UPI0025D60FEB
MSSASLATAIGLLSESVSFNSTALTADKLMNASVELPRLWRSRGFLLHGLYTLMSIGLPCYPPRP